MRGGETMKGPKTKFGNVLYFNNVSIGKSLCRSGFIAPNKMCRDILTLTGIDATITSCNTNVDKSYFLLGKKKTKILFNYLYTDCSIFLQRKKNKMETIIGNTEVSK